MAIVMGLDQHRAQITAEWLDTVTGEVSRGRSPGSARARCSRWRSWPRAGFGDARREHRAGEPRCVEPLASSASWCAGAAVVFGDGRPRRRQDLTPGRLMAGGGGASGTAWASGHYATSVQVGGGDLEDAVEIVEVERELTDGGLPVYLKRRRDGRPAVAVSRSRRWVSTRAIEKPRLVLSVRMSRRIPRPSSYKTRTPKVT